MMNKDKFNAHAKLQSELVRTAHVEQDENTANLLRAAAKAISSLLTEVFNHHKQINKISKNPRFKVVNTKTGNDITNERFWLLGHDGKLYYMDYDLHGLADTQVILLTGDDGDETNF